MRQTVLSAVLEVQPANADTLKALIARVRAQEETKPPADPAAKSYDRLRNAVPVLQFMSWTVFADDQYDPVLVLECNFDGAPGPFWAQLEALYGDDLRAMARLCQRPPGTAGGIYDRVTAPASKAPVAPLLEAVTVRPQVFHIGNRGLPRDRIERETALFRAVQAMLDSDPSLRSLTAPALRARLRTALLPRFPWLNRPEPARITAAENAADWLNLACFLLLVLAALAVPGWIVARAFAPWVGALLWVAATLAAGASLHWMRDPDLPKALGRFFQYLTGVVLIAAFASFAIAPALGGCIASAGALVAVLLARIDVLERYDPPQAAPNVPDAMIRKQTAAEDQISQNHMISLVHVKPSALRTVLMRAGLRGLGLALRIIARDGYLGSMRTIHFAHWGLVSNGGRLMFHSNFDGTWESYLDDFIEKAHGGLTLAWCNGIGFPPTRFLVLDGATNGRAFKTWARHSMAPADMWFSAHRDLTVNLIERQSAVADGLRAATLADDKAAAWAGML